MSEIGNSRFLFEANKVVQNRNYKKEMSADQNSAIMKAMETHKKVQELTEANNKLRQQIQERQEIFERLSQLTLSSAALLSSVDSTAPVTEMSSVKCLSKLEESSAVNGEDEKKDEDQVKLIIGKYLNHLLVKLVDFAEKNPEQIDILGMQDIEEGMAELYHFAEDRGIIPETKPTDGWKQSVAIHQQLFEKLKSIMSAN